MSPPAAGATSRERGRSATSGDGVAVDALCHTGGATTMQTRTLTTVPDARASNQRTGATVGVVQTRRQEAGRKDSPLINVPGLNLPGRYIHI